MPLHSITRLPTAPSRPLHSSVQNCYSAESVLANRRTWFSIPSESCVARSFLPRSACRHAARTVSSPTQSGFGVQSLRIPSRTTHEADQRTASRACVFLGFLLIVRTGRIVTRPLGPVPPDTRSFQHTAEFTSPCYQGVGQLGFTFWEETAPVKLPT